MSRHKSRARSQRSPVLIALTALVSTLALVVLVWWGVGAVTHAQQQARLDRIEAIYASLNLDENSYAITGYNVFGEKKPYDWDQSRSQSSAIEYVHADTVSATVSDLDARIKAAGFEYFEEPYPGSVFTEYHYKSSKNEYIRLNVISKPYADAIRSDAIMNESFGDGFASDEIDTNQAPVNVTIKVNLDDNNE